MPPERGASRNESNPKVTTHVRHDKSPRYQLAAAAAIAGSALLGTAGTASATSAIPSFETSPNGVATVEIRPTIDQSFALRVHPAPATQDAFPDLLKAGSVPAGQRTFKIIPNGLGTVNIVSSSGATRCVETVSDSNPSLVFATTCNGSAKQKWIIDATAGGHRIRNFATKTVMAPSIGGPLGDLPVTEIAATSTVGKVKQSWKITNV